jgi:hypothetical protein
MTVTAPHKISRTFAEVEIVPGHQPRKESKEFRDNKKRLVADGHGGCWVGQGCSGGCQTHHYGIEWSLWDDVDPALLQEFLLEWDVYGYSKVLRGKPITGPDDIRNLMNLCEHHHIASGFGIHFMTFPLWISQKIALSGKDPIVKA